MTGSGVRRGVPRGLHEVRVIVEPAAARPAAVRAGDAQVGELGEALAAMDAAGDGLEAVAADLRFHRALLAATGNELPTKVPSHRRVVDAVRAHDPEAAERAMRELLAEAAEDLTEIRSL